MSLMKGNQCLAGRRAVEGKGGLFFKIEVVVFSCGREDERELGAGGRDPFESVSWKLEDPEEGGRKGGDIYFMLV